MNQTNGQDRPAARKRTRVGESRTPMHLVFQGGIGVILGLGLASVISLPPAQLALTGVLISIAAWVVEQGFRLPSPATRDGAGLRLALRLVSLIGFTLSVSSLAALVA